MSRTADDAEITTRAARERLQGRHEPYWRSIEGRLALGYRKGTRGGTWIARQWGGAGYRKVVLGRADDLQKATRDKNDEAGLEGEAGLVLDFRHAQAAALAWASRLNRVAAGLEPESPATPAAPYTVADAMTDYLADYAARGGKSLAATRATVDAHILPALGALPVGRLTRDKLKAWHRGLAAAPARLRAGKGQTRARPPAADPDAQRRRRSSANRILTVLKAALNHARAEGKITCPDDAWAMVKPFREADAPKVRYLLDDELVRLVNACPPDFRQLVTAALLTGCRYGELAALTAVDFDPTAGTVTVARSKAGRPRHIALTDEGQLFFGQIAAGKSGGARLFEREGTVQQATRDAPAVTRRVAWGKSDQFRMMRDACEAGKITPAISFHELRHTYAARLAQRGVPMGVIAAQLGHADTRMTERHYAHLGPGYIAETIRQSFGTLGIVPVTNVAAIRSTP